MNLSCKNGRYCFVFCRNLNSCSFCMKHNNITTKMTTTTTTHIQPSLRHIQKAHKTQTKQILALQSHKTYLRCKYKIYPLLYIHPPQTQTYTTHCKCRPIQQNITYNFTINISQIFTREQRANIVK